MNLPPISMDAIIALDAVNRRKSFALAAEELHKVPSAISYIIQRAEKELEVTLIDRSGHRAILTEAGKAFLEDGLSILQSINSLIQKTKQVDDGCEREISIAVDSLFPLTKVFPLVKAFHEIYPYVTVKLLEEVFGGSWDALYTGRASLVIGATDQSLRNSRYKTKLIGEAEFIFAVSPNHPICALKQPISVEELEKQIAVVAADSSRSLSSRTAGLLDKQIMICVPSIQDKIKAQVEGLGIGFLPKHLIVKELQEKKLVELKVELQREKNILFISWDSRAEGKALKWFLEKLSERDFLDGLFD